MHVRPQAATELSERALHKRCEALDRELQIGRTRALDAFDGGASLAFEIGEALVVTSFLRVLPPSHLSPHRAAAPIQQHPSPRPEQLLLPLPLPLPSQPPIDSRLLGHQPLPPRTLAPRAAMRPYVSPYVSAATCPTDLPCTSIALRTALGSSALVPTASADGTSMLCQPTQLPLMPPPPTPPPTPPQLRVPWECATSSSDVTAPTCSTLEDSTLEGCNTRAELATPASADPGAAEDTDAAFLAATVLQHAVDVSVVRRMQWDVSTTASAVPPHASLVTMDSGCTAPAGMPHLGGDPHVAVVDEMLDFLEAASFLPDMAESMTGTVDLAVAGESAVQAAHGGD